MAKFEGEEYIVLGEVGRFSISTLEEMNRQMSPSPIEEKFRTLLRDYDRIIEELKSYKIGIFCKLQDVRWRLRELESLEARRISLEEAIRRYYKAFPGRRILPHHLRDKHDLNPASLFADNT